MIMILLVLFMLLIIFVIIAVTYNDNLFKELQDDVWYNDDKFKERLKKAEDIICDVISNRFNNKLIKTVDSNNNIHFENKGEDIYKANTTVSVFKIFPKTFQSNYPIIIIRYSFIGYDKVEKIFESGELIVDTINENMVRKIINNICHFHNDVRCDNLARIVTLFQNTNLNYNND